MKCQRCIRGQVFKDSGNKYYCINCSAEHDKYGHLIRMRIRGKDDYERLEGEYSKAGTCNIWKV